MKPLNPAEPFPGRNESLSQTADFAVRALHAVAANVAILAEDVELRVARLADDVGAVGQDIQGGGWSNRILDWKRNYTSCRFRDYK